MFQRAEKAAGIELGSIRATVLVETLPAVFQMNEILHELREHSAGLNCGRWDYIFSYVKTFSAHPDRLLPDRALVGMAQHFMRSYSHLLIHTCHRRGVHAMGGMVNKLTIYLRRGVHVTVTNRCNELNRRRLRSRSRTMRRRTRRHWSWCARTS